MEWMHNGRHGHVLPGIHNGHPAKFTADHATPEQYRVSKYASLYEQAFSTLLRLLVTLCDTPDASTAAKAESGAVATKQ